MKCSIYSDSFYGVGKVFAWAFIPIRLTQVMDLPGGGHNGASLEDCHVFSGLHPIFGVFMRG